MSAAGPIQKTDQDEDDQSFMDQLDLLEQVRYFVLFPPDKDFSQVCSCDVCRPKIQCLNEFQKEIKAKMSLISKYGADLDNNKENHCLSITLSAYWPRRMLGFLENKLKAAVSEGSGVSWTLEKSDSAAAELKRIDKEIAKRLNDAGLLGDPGDTIQMTMMMMITMSISWIKLIMGNTKAKDEAYVLFEGIESLEKDWLMHKETSDAHKLERQIEIVKKFPVGKLQDEVEELIEKIPSREFFSMIFGKARDYIYNVSYSFIRKRQEFWKGFSLPTKGNDHSSNGLKETLDSLIEEVISFKERWNEEFAPVFTPRDRSNPKRQLVD
ncbi:hypothetical protein CASFOL_003414 [Castilleja foliolosa]|uniref:Uncharacterized protein n=1 Tax=Castilleja foliolosa TaxID=1961234 RepID=A0ABD3EHF0_9LAMI